MTELVLAGKVLCLLIGGSYGAAWLLKAVRGHPIANVQTFLMVGGAVGFITLQWLI